MMVRALTLFAVLISGQAMAAVEKPTPAYGQFSKRCFDFVYAAMDDAASFGSALAATVHPQATLEKLTQHVRPFCQDAGDPWCKALTDDLWSVLLAKTQKHVQHFANGKSTAVQGSVSYGQWCKKLYASQDQHAPSLVAAALAKAPARKAVGDPKPKPSQASEKPVTLSTPSAVAIPAATPATTSKMAEEVVVHKPEVAAAMPLAAVKAAEVALAKAESTAAVATPVEAAPSVAEHVAVSHLRKKVTPQVLKRGFETELAGAEVIAESESLANSDSDVDGVLKSLGGAYSAADKLRKDA